MENVIEKHYVPTSGSGLDANLVAALMNNNNKSLDPATVAIDSVDEITFTNPDGTTSTDYLIIVKIIQNLSYCTRSLVGYREATRTKTTYECFIMPKDTGATEPQISASYEYDAFITHCNYVVPNIAKTRNHAIVISVRNSATAPSA